MCGGSRRRGERQRLQQRQRRRQWQYLLSSAVSVEELMQPVEFGEPQVGGNVTAFHIGADGGLEPTGAVRQVGTPVWLMFVQDGWWFRHGFQ